MKKKRKGVQSQAPRCPYCGSGEGDSLGQHQALHPTPKGYQETELTQKGGPQTLPISSWYIILVMPIVGRING